MMQKPLKRKATIWLEPWAYELLSAQARRRRCTVSAMGNKLLTGQIQYGWILAALLFISAFSIGLGIGLSSVKIYAALEAAGN